MTDERLLGELESAVMSEVWRGGEVSVREVHEALRPERQLAYTTVLATMRNLVKKGYLARESAGRGHVYRARRDQGTVARSTVKTLLERLFDGSPTRFANALFDGEELTPGQFEKLRLEILQLRDDEAAR